MGGDAGGMVDESGHFPEVCKKSVQAQTSDMQPGIGEEFFARNDIDALRRLTSREADGLGRLAFPVALFPGEQHFRRISWDDALRLAATALTDAHPDETFFYMSGRSSNEAAFLTQLVARAYGTPHIHNCSFYCHNASSVALTDVYGSGTSSVDLADLAETDLAVVIGANPASNHPRLITQLIRLRERGGKVIVINPVAELGLQRFRLPSDPVSLLRGSQVSDLYLQPTVGGDIALLTGLLKHLIEAGGVDERFVAERTNGWESVLATVTAIDWDTVVQRSGVPESTIRECAAVMAAAPTGIMMWAMGLTHHAHGTDNIRALANLALARGWLGTPGAGLLPIRGHSNVQGVGSMGVSPHVKETFARVLSERYGISGADRSGHDTYASMTAAHGGGVRAAIMLGGNLWGSNPDSEWAATALRTIDTTFAITTTLNPGHFHGNGRTAVIVPALARDEEMQTTTQESMFNYVRFSSGGAAAGPPDARSEVEIIASLAERILPPHRFDWSALRSHEALRKAISHTVAGYADIHRPELRRSERREFTVGGRVRHTARFATPDGRANFHAVPLPQPQIGDGDLMLMTLRSEGQFNTVVYDEEDLYRGTRSRAVVMLNRADASDRGIADGDIVRVSSATGAMEVVAAVIDISAGSAAMYYPEANALVDRVLDPQSRTPAFKSVPVRVTPAGTDAHPNPS